ncbi:hypothetical protein BDV93DRAFT_511135 [Ceratobasidium sp. AG-I]|nr:hypothetical protein BDV93DRAFT_511135 [Ceratobasidium sp. AG-I]
MPPSSKEATLKLNMLDAVDSVPLLSMRKFSARTQRFIDAYASRSLKWGNPESPPATQDVGRAAQPANTRIARLGEALDLEGARTVRGPVNSNPCVWIDGFILDNCTGIMEESRVFRMLDAVSGAYKYQATLSKLIALNGAGKPGSSAGNTRGKLARGMYLKLFPGIPSSAAAGKTPGLTGHPLLPSIAPVRSVALVIPVFPNYYKATLHRRLSQPKRSFLSTITPTAEHIMASHSPNEKISAIRHRIKEITLHPGTSKYPIGLEILVDKKTLHRLPNIGPSQPLIWDAQMYPCDAYIGAKVELRFTEKHRTFSDRQVLVDYTVLDEPNLPPVTKQVVGFPSLITAFGVSSNKPTVPGLNDLLKVVVKFPNFDKDYSSALMKASEMMKDSNGPLEKMGNTRIVLKSLLEFGTVVAQLHPAAGLVVGLCTQAWEYLEKVQDEHDDLRRLITGLEHMRPFIESVKGRAKEAALKHTTLALLYLIEDTSNSVINYVSRASAGELWY